MKKLPILIEEIIFLRIDFRINEQIRVRRRFKKI